MPVGDRLCFRLVCKGWTAAGAAVAAPPPGEEPLGPRKATRTRRKDTAVSIAQTKMAMGVLDGPAQVRLKSGLSAY